jgi:MFS family permease
VPVAHHLDPAAALAFRTPLHEHVLSADGKAAGVITLLGMMFTVLARFAAQLSDLVKRGPLRYFFLGLILGFAGSALCAVLQSFRTMSPRFPKAPPSLAFFGDIARLTREEYVARVEALSPDDALRQMLSYNHTASRICVDKLKQLRLGLRTFQWAAACWILLVVILVVKAYVPW